MIAVIFLTSVSLSIRAGSPSFPVGTGSTGDIASAVGYAAVIYVAFLILSVGCVVYAARNEVKEEIEHVALEQIDVERELMEDAQV